MTAVTPLLVLRGMQYEKAGVVPPEEDDPAGVESSEPAGRTRFETDWATSGPR